VASASLAAVQGKYELSDCITDAPIATKKSAMIWVTANVDSAVVAEIALVAAVRVTNKERCQGHNSELSIPSLPQQLLFCL
jgi:hypothetical protein